MNGDDYVEETCAKYYPAGQGAALRTRHGVDVTLLKLDTFQHVTRRVLRLTSDALSRPSIVTQFQFQSWKMYDQVMRHLAAVVKLLLFLILQLSIEAHTGTPPAADWKRPPDRPRRTWLQQVEEGIGLSVGAAQIASQDRSMWRTLRPSAGQAQQ